VLTIGREKEMFTKGMDDVKECTRVNDYRDVQENCREQQPLKGLGMSTLYIRRRNEKNN